MLDRFNCYKKGPLVIFVPSVKHVLMKLQNNAFYKSSTNFSRIYSFVSFKKISYFVKVTVEFYYNYANVFWFLCILCSISSRFTKREHLRVINVVYSSRSNRLSAITSWFVALVTSATVMPNINPMKLYLRISNANIMKMLL